ncbi:MAG: VWA domain-containing protein [Eubacteriales bacterium]|nr:VWA domain-containing protein [Eubacteriales bacterium]
MKWKRFISTVLVCVLMAVTFIPASAQSGEVPIWIRQDGGYQGANGTSYDQDYIDEILDEDSGYEDGANGYDSDSDETATASNVSTASDWMTASGSNWATASNAFETVVFTEAGPFMPAVYVGGRARALSRARMKALAEEADTDTSSLKLNKTAAANGDGSYTITLESYTTGKVTTVTETQPVDIVLVLDQSGSMGDNFGSGTRQAAMKEAVAGFIYSVGDQYNAETSDHRISLVTFGSDADILSDDDDGDGWTYVDNKGVSKLENSVDKLPSRPNGATNVGAGMIQAELQLNKEYTGSNPKRQRVVVVFTDGVPTTGNQFDTGVANTAIKTAKRLKDEGITVYTIGIFEGANTEQTYGDINFDQNSDGTVGSKWYNRSIIKDDACDVPAGNRFLNYLSSNSADAEEIGIEKYNYLFDSGWKITKNFSCDKGYYLAADDVENLKNAFESISGNISQADTSLDSNTVVRDVVSQYFEIPEGAAIKTYTADYTKEGAFDDPVQTENVTVTQNGDVIEVTGFDYYKNFVDENRTGRDENDPSAEGDFCGRKLIIEFTVQPKDGFLGGNDVPTNDPSSGFYLTGDDQEPLKPFDQPTVNVPVPELAVTAEDKYVYLTGSLTEDDLKEGLKVSAGEAIELDLSKDGYGLKDWQHAFVDITAGWSPDPGSLTNLTADSSYTVKVSIVSKTDKENSSEAGAEAGIFVFKPVFTFQDGEGFYGDSLPDETYMNSLRNTEIQWEHENKNYEKEVMTGEEPKDFQFGYSPEPGFIQDGKINTKKDLPVTVSSVKLPGIDTELIGFCKTVREKCNPDEPDLEGNGHFVLHIKTGQLTIKKTGGAADEPYVFTIMKDGRAYTQASVMGDGEVTVKELPKGSYTIVEDGAWSWRYRGVSEGTAELSADAPVGTLTCQNTPFSNKQYWLNGFSAVVKNIFQTKTTGKAVR